MRRNPLFLGLVRPPMTLGLPMLFWPPVMSAGVLPLIWFKSFIAGVLCGLLAYAMARIAARFEPRIFELAGVAGRLCARTRSNSFHGGNRYEP